MTKGRGNDGCREERTVALDLVLERPTGHRVVGDGCLGDLVQPGRETPVTRREDPDCLGGGESIELAVDRAVAMSPDEIELTSASNILSSGLPRIAATRPSARLIPS